MRDVTITSLVYMADTKTETESPLGETVTETIVLDNLVATFTVAGVDKTFELHFRPEAVGNRIVGYELDDPFDAVAALVRERVFAWAPDLQPSDPTDRVQVNGGTDPRVTVSWADEARAQGEALLADERAQDRLAAAIENFKT